MLQACERAIPRSAAIDAFLREQQPDVVLFTPLIGVVASPQLDCLQSARALGYPTALCVWSWDHLSSKAILRTVPDRVFVWNDTQREEAVTLHGVPPERVVVTGAQCFDQWFDRRPSLDRDAVLPEGRAAGRTPVPAVRLFGSVPGQRQRGAVRAALDARAARKRAGAAGVHADPGAPASGAA